MGTDFQIRVSKNSEWGSWTLTVDAVPSKFFALDLIAAYDENVVEKKTWKTQKIQPLGQMVADRQLLKANLRI